MKRSDLTDRIARQGRTTREEAADRLDRVVHDLIQRLRRGQRVSLPGLGELSADSKKAAAEGETPR
jgi:nucleoid DNA-binding protein